MASPQYDYDHYEVQQGYAAKLDVSLAYITDSICDLFVAWPNEYIFPIAKEIADDVARDIYETANIEEWNNDDVRLAVGRVLCSRLGIEL